jgi:hypothetical protein
MKQLILLLLILSTTTVYQMSYALPGTYLQTCSQCSVKPAASGKQVLSCECKQQNGFSNSTTLWNPEKCAYIVNDNGTLNCTTPPAQPQQPQHKHKYKHKHHHLPPGNYRETCEQCRVKHHALHCTCQRDDGSWNLQAIFNGHCNGGLSNQDGYLVCK